MSQALVAHLVNDDGNPGCNGEGYRTVPQVMRSATVGTEVEGNADIPILLCAECVDAWRRGLPPPRLEVRIADRE